MSQMSEENEFSEEISGKSGSPNKEPSGVQQEAVSALSGNSNFRNLARSAAVAVLTLIDGANAPPQITGTEESTKAGNGKEKEKGNELASAKPVADAQHNQEVLNILMNADSILDKHHRAPIDSIAKQKDIAPSSAERPSVKDPARLNNDVAKAQRAELDRKAQEIRQAELKKQAQADAISAEFLSARLADINAKKEAPEPLHVSTAKEALEAKELAEELNLPLVVDVYTDSCHYCKEMDNEALAYLEGRKSAAGKPKMDAVYVHINDGTAQEGTAQALNVGSINAYPHVAIFKPSNYNSPTYAHGGKLSYSEFASLIEDNE